jgi:hypothetical protein
MGRGGVGESLPRPRWQQGAGRCPRLRPGGWRSGGFGELRLRSLGRVGQVYDLACPFCPQVRVRIPAGEERPKPSHVLLPGGKSGANVSLHGSDQRWVDDLEMRWRGGREAHSS